MRTRFLLILSLLVAWGSMLSLRAAAQAPSEPPTSAAEGTGAPAAGVAVTVRFRGLSPGETLRVGPVEAAPVDETVSPDGTTEVEMTPGQTYDVQWGGPSSLERLRMYVPAPADPTAPRQPVQVTLRPGLRRVPDQAWRYEWAAGENRRMAAAVPALTEAPPTPRPQPQKPPETPVVTPPAAAPNPSPDPLPAALPAAAGTAESDGEPRDLAGRAVGGAALGLSILLLVLALWFYTSIWNPHRAGVAQALDKSLPDALRAQSQQAGDLQRRLEETHKQWQHDRETLRRGQELLASHTGPAALAAHAEELSRLRREVEDLRRLVIAAQSRGGAPPAGGPE